MKNEVLSKGWNEIDNHLVKKFEFKGYNKTISFVNAVAWVANRHNHHPELIVNYNNCVVKTTTHDAGNKITTKDYLLAEDIEKL